MEASLMPQEMLHGHEVVVVVADGGVEFIQDPIRAEDRGVQMQFPLFLQPHYAYCRKKL